MSQRAKIILTVVKEVDLDPADYEGGEAKTNAELLDEEIGILRETPELMLDDGYVEITGRLIKEGEGN